MPILSVILYALVFALLFERVWFWKSEYPFLWKTKKLIETNWNQNTPKPIDFQPFWSVSIENFTNRNIQFLLAIAIQTDRNQTKHTPNLGGGGDNVMRK